MSSAEMSIGASISPLSGYFPNNQGIFPDGPDISRVPCSGMAKTMIDCLQKRLEAKLRETGKRPAPFAAEVDLKVDVIRDIIRKGSMPSADKVAKIADGLDVSIDYLLGRTDNPKATADGEITSEPEILAFLARIKDLSPSDINTAFGVIMMALNAKRAGSAPSEDRDQPGLSNRPHGSEPSRSKSVQRTS
jgi:transcriptional regulator with XRE-family HTH domain